MTFDERLKALPIYARTALLMITTLITADLTMLLFQPKTSALQPPPPMRLEDIARSLSGGGRDQHPPGEPPPEVNGGGPADLGGSPPPEPPRFGPGGPGAGAGGATGGLARSTSRTRPGPPSQEDLSPNPMLAQRLAERLRLPTNAVIAYASEPLSPSSGTGSDDPGITGSLWVSALTTDGLWHTVALKSEPTTARWRWEIGWIIALEAVVLLPLGWLFTYTLSAPLRRFTEAARIAGHDASSAPVAREGPAEMIAAIDGFNAMQARLKRLLQERTQMVGAIAHDLRTPLTRLAFRLDDLAGPTGEKVRSDIEEMRTMIAAALDFIRDQTLRGQYERLDFRLLVERVVEEQSDLGHDVSLVPGAAVTIEGTPLALRRAVANLIDNAIKYGERARLSLSVRDTDCLLDVDDDGPGIPEALQSQVFDPFFRIEGSRNRNTGGIGLGLAAVRTIVLEHSGDITLRNRKPQGLRVTVILPLSS